MIFNNIKLEDAIHYLRYSVSGNETLEYLDVSVAYTVKGKVELLEGTYPEVNEILRSKTIQMTQFEPTAIVTVKGSDSAGNKIDYNGEVPNIGVFSPNTVFIKKSFVNVHSTKEYNKLLVNKIAEKKITDKYPLWKQNNILMSGDAVAINKMKEDITEIVNFSNALCNKEAKFNVECGKYWSTYEV